MRRMLLLKGAGQKLAGEKMDVIVDGENTRFMVQVLKRRRRMATSDSAEALVLLSLNVLDVRRFQVRRIYRRGVIDY